MNKVTHKYGLEVPRKVTQAYELNKRHNNTLWADAINKEMTNFRVAFEVKDKDTLMAPGYS